MARSGIYKSEVARARDNLLAMGRHPSIDAIRIELGNTGSKATIHRYLKEIEEENGGVMGTQVAVSDAIQDLASRLAERLHQEADQRIEVLSKKHREEVAALNEAFSALRNEAEAFRKQTEHLTLELSAEKSAHETTTAKVQEGLIVAAQQAQQITGLNDQLAKAEAHRISLEEKHQYSREALEHFRQAAKEQRDQDQRQFEQQIQFLQSELRTTKDTLNSKQQELISSHESNAKLSSDLAHAKTENHHLEAEVRSMRQSKELLAVAEVKNQQLSEQLEIVTSKLTELGNENLATSEKLRGALDARDQLDSDLKVANAVLASQEQIIQKIAVLQTPSSKISSTKKAGDDVQNSLFGPEQSSV